jgi:hypothetical protein
MSYAQDTWGVPPPQEKPAKEYAVNDIVGKTVFDDISHKRTATASKIVMLVVPDGFTFEKDAMAAHSMPPEHTNWDRASTYGPRIMKRIALMGQALATLKPGNKIFVPYLRMKALDACNIKKSGSVHVADDVPESIRGYGETKSYKYSNPTPPSEHLWNAVTTRGTSKKGSLFEASGGRIKETIPPIFDESMGRTADFDSYSLTRMRDVHEIVYTFKWPSTRDSFSQDEVSALRRVGVRVSSEADPVQKARIAYSIQTARVPRLGGESSWGILQFESYLKKSPGAPTLSLPTQSPRAALTDRDIPRVTDMVQRNARSIMLMRQSARHDGDRYLYQVQGRRGEQPREVDIGEDMPLYESLNGIKRTCNQMIWHSVTGIPEGIPVEMKGQMGSEVETHGGTTYMGTMYLRKTRLASKIFDLAMSPDAEVLMSAGDRVRLIEASKLLCRGTDPLTLLQRDPEFASIRDINWSDLSPDVKQRIVDKSSHMAGDEDVAAQRQRRDDPSNWPALKFLGQKLHEFIADGTLEMERDDFVDGNSITQVYEPYKQRRPVVNNYGMPMIVDEQLTHRDENGEIVGEMATRPYSEEDFRAGKKVSMENLDISASHEFEPMVHQGVTYGRAYDPETGREVFKPIPGLRTERVKGIPVVYPANQMEFKYSFGRQERRSVKGVMWKVMDEDAKNKPQPGEVIEAIIQIPEVFTKVLDPKQNMDKVLKELKGWELTKLDQYLRKTYKPNGVKYSTKNKAPTAFSTRDFAKARRAADHPLMVPQYEVVGGLRQRRVDEAGNPVMVEASEANLDIERYDGSNYFRQFAQGLDVMRAFFGSGPNTMDAWSDRSIGPYPNLSLHDVQVAFHTVHDGMSLYLRYKNQGNLDMQAGTWTDASGQVHQFTAEEMKLLRTGQSLLSSIMEVGPIEETGAAGEEGDEGDEEDEGIRIPTSYYRDAAMVYEAARRAAQNPDQQAEIMATVFGPERGTMYAVMRRGDQGPEMVRLGADYVVVFPYEIVAREWVRTHHPEDETYFVAPVPADGPLPLAPSHIENLGDPSVLATASEATEMFNQASIVDALREMPEEEPGEAVPAEDVPTEEPVEEAVPASEAEQDLFDFQEGEPEVAVPADEVQEPVSVTAPVTAPATPVTTPVVPSPARQDREAAAIRRLVALADRLDDAGRNEESDAVDGVIQYSLKRLKEER